MTIENNPYEIMGLERWVERHAADYIEKEALLRIKENDLSQKLAGAEKVPVAAGAR